MPCMAYTCILDIPQVAITLYYRYQPPAGAPLDAGIWCRVMGKLRFPATHFCRGFIRGVMETGGIAICTDLSFVSRIGAGHFVERPDEGLLTFPQTEYPW